MTRHRKKIILELGFDTRKKTSSLLCNLNDTIHLPLSLAGRRLLFKSGYIWMGGETEQVKSKLELLAIKFSI